MMLAATLLTRAYKRGHVALTLEDRLNAFLVCQVFALQRP